MKKRKLFIELSVVALILFLLSWIFIPKFLDHQNINTEQAFPDPNLRQAVQQLMTTPEIGFGIGAYGLGKTQQAETQSASPLSKPFYRKDTIEKEAFIEVQNLTSLKGLEHFPKLKVLKFSTSMMEEVDVSFLSNLEELKIDGASVKKIIFPKHDKLRSLTLKNVLDTLINVSSMPNLERLNIFNVNLEFIGLSQNKKLMSFICDSTKLQSLDFSHNPTLLMLQCTFSNLSTLDISQNPMLAAVDIRKNELKQLDLSNNPNIQILNVDHNQLQSLTLPTQTSLKELICSHNQLAGLEIINSSSLTTLICSENALKQLNVKAFKSLNILDCSYNQIANLDVSQNTLLSQLHCASNPIDLLHLLGLNQLNRLGLDLNQLENANFTYSNPDLKIALLYKILLTEEEEQSFYDSVKRIKEQNKPNFVEAEEPESITDPYTMLLNQ